MTDIEDDPARTRLLDLAPHVASAIGRRVRKHAAAMGQDVAGAQPFENVFAPGRRRTDMDHHRQSQFFGCLDRDVERTDPDQFGYVAADPHFDATNEAGILARDLYAGAGVQQPQVGGFAHHETRAIAVDAGMGDIQERDDTQRARLDDEPSETREGACAGGAGVDEGRGAARAGDALGLDAEVGCTPIDMRVNVDQAGSDDLARDVLFAFRAGAREIGADGSNLAPGKGDVGNAVETLARVNDAPAVNTRSYMVGRFSFDNNPGDRRSWTHIVSRPLLFYYSIAEV